MTTLRVSGALVGAAAGAVVWLAGVFLPVGLTMTFLGYGGIDTSPERTLAAFLALGIPASMAIGAVVGWAIGGDQ